MLRNLILEILKGQKSNRVFMEIFPNPIGGQSGRIDISVHGNQAGECDLHGHDPVVQTGSQGQYSVFQLIHRKDVGNVGNA